MGARLKIGFVGIGIMGAPMVRRLMAQGWQVSVWNLEPERYAEVPGATVLESPAAVRAAAFNRFADALEGAYAGASDARSRGGAVGEAYVNFAFNESASYRLMFDMSQPDEADYPDLVRASTRARRTMTDYVRGLVDAGVLAGDPILIGHVFFATLHGAVVLQLAGKLGEECSFETISREAFRALIAGFAPKG